MDEDLLTRAEGLLRRYNFNGQSITLDTDVIKWLADLNTSRGIVSNFGEEHKPKWRRNHNVKV